MISTMFYDTFEEALEAWREQGGALNYYCGDSSSPEGWEVIDIWIAEDYTRGASDDECKSPRELTEHALAMGGLTPEQIAQEMVHWQD